jgi:hypothetical protein
MSHHVKGSNLREPANEIAYIYCQYFINDLFHYWNEVWKIK